MKFVIKYKETIKLISSQTTYQQLLSTIERQFGVRKSTIHMSYIDEEGDQITMGEDGDIQIMRIVNKQKEYVKIYVEGQALMNFSKQKNIFQESSIRFDDGSEIPSQDPKPDSQVNHQSIAKKEIFVLKETHRNEKVSIKQQAAIQDLPLLSILQRNEVPLIHSRLEDRPLIRQASTSIIQSNKQANSQKQLKETVAKLVDQRIKILLPCLRELICQRDPKNEYEPKLIHQNVECQGCLALHIFGIRYQCIECPNFNLCERCQIKIYHKHNLLKVKQIARKCQNDSINEQSSKEKQSNCSKPRTCQKKSNHRYSWNLKKYNFNQANLDQSFRSDCESSSMKKEISSKEELLKINTEIKVQQKMAKKQQQPQFNEKDCQRLKIKQQTLNKIKEILGADKLNISKAVEIIDSHFGQKQDFILNLILDS